MSGPAATRPAIPRGRELAMICAIFAVSGASALVYQVAWQRIMALQSGLGIFSVTVIVAAFMTGLGLGSYLGGNISSRIDASTALRIFAGLEVVIGVFALLSITLYYHLLYGKALFLYESLWSAGIAHFLALAVPTCLMGMSLPFLVHATVASASGAFRTIGFLYGINVVGAASGALLTPWFLIPALGIDGAVYVAGVGNLLVGASAFLLWRKRRGQTFENTASESAFPPSTERVRLPFNVWVLLYTAAGFFSLALEILWFRIIDVGVKSTAFTFGTVLSVFLFGLAGGALLGVRVAGRVRRPLRAFLLYQTLLLTYAGAVIVALAYAPPGLPVYRRFFEYWALPYRFQFGQTWDTGFTLTFYVLFPFVLYLVPTMLMGLSFAVLQRAVHDDRRTTGQKVGILMYGNIAGNVLGSLLTGLLLLETVGAMGTLRTLLVLGLVFPLIGVVYAERKTPFYALGAAIGLLLIAVPDNKDWWLRLHGQTSTDSVLAENATGVVAFIAEPAANRVDWRLSINGKQHSYVPFGGRNSQMGALAAIVHEAPRDVMIIGLGAGDTAWSAGCRQETQNVEVYELMGQEKPLLQRLESDGVDPRLSSFLADPRYRIFTADGRNALSFTDRRYDVIESDALSPGTAYSGSLYSVEFFRLAASRLKPGGLMCQWGSTPRVRRTFYEAFPHVIEFLDGEILVGSNEPIEPNPRQWMAMLGRSDVRSYLGPGVLRAVIQAVETVRPARRDEVADLLLNRDLFPRDEFRVPLRREIGGVNW